MSIASIQSTTTPIALQQTAPPAPQTAAYNAVPGSTTPTPQEAQPAPPAPIPAESVSQQAEMARSAETAKLGAQLQPPQQSVPQSSAASRAQLELRQLDVDPVKPSPRYAVQAYQSAARSRGEDAPNGGLDSRA